MSISTVTSRIQQIQAQLAMLPSSATGTSATAFTGELDAARTVGRTTSGGGATGDQVVAEARKMLGLPYVWGGTDPQRGVDCSGLVQTAYKALGIDLPRVSADQARAGTPVASLADARPGDLLAWDNSSRNQGADHVAIYIGGGRMIEAARPGTLVRISEVTTPPDYIRRIIPGDAVGGTSLGKIRPGTPFADLFNKAGLRNGVDPALLAAVARQESGYDPRAVSPAGAQGLMQLMPATARGLGVSDPFDPAQAIDGAARMLHDLIGRFGHVDLALAAYNAGPGAVTRYGGIPPYPETQHYVESVLGMWRSAA